MANTVRSASKPSGKVVYNDNFSKAAEKATADATANRSNGRRPVR